MSWWGKLLGGAFGFMLGGPLGALLGAVMGHQLDRGMQSARLEGPELQPQQRERVQTAFFTATFSVMGHIAKADGQVTRDEIRIAEMLMQQMDLDAQQRKLAMALFRQGKAADFDLQGVLDQFREQLGRQRNLLRIFIEIQVQLALSDGVMHAAEEHLLLQICRRLGIRQAEFRAIVYLVKASGQFAGEQRQQQESRSSTASPAATLDDAYELLGVDSSAADSEVKKAYRRQLSRHHPDKLVSRGLPEEMMKVATDKTHQIKQAYEMIKKARGL
jgi:DnaJ like chaperone protein